nr:RNB domain-containing ribonuclease [Tessaracoccus coleopterorum]
MDDVPTQLREGLGQLQERLDLPKAFPADVLADAQKAASLPAPGHTDRTDIEFVTIDPAASTDLDQAMQIERDGDGYLVRYAISDVGHFVRTGTALEAETHRRGQTKYAPGARIPLHPEVLSEGAASLLADGTPRPAMLWELRLDAEGELADVSLTRAMVLSRAKLSYAGAQDDLTKGTAHPSIALLPEVGRLRERLEIAREACRSTCPTRRSSNVTAPGSWRSGRSTRWRPGTRRSRC